MEMPMVLNNMISRRIDAGAIILVISGLVAALQADEFTLLTPKQPPAATKILSFPSGERIGSLYLEPESGPDWDDVRLRLPYTWEDFGIAEGDVHVPQDRNIQLHVRLAISPQENARLLAQIPRKHQVFEACRMRPDPHDLSWLLELDPNDLYRLSVDSLMKVTDANRRVLEPIRHLTGLRMLSLTDTGVTAKGLEHLRPLRSLRLLELTESSVSNRGLAVLKDLPALEYLQLGYQVSDAGLKQVAQCRNLRCLYLQTGKIWGPGLAELAKLPRLERLCISGSIPISDRHIKYLENLTHLKSLTLWGGAVERLTDTSLVFISRLKNLEELHFIGWSSPRFSSVGIAHLGNLKQLKKLDFGSSLTSEGMKHGDEIVRQLTALPHLESLKGISYLTAEGMKTLGTFRKLRCLTVSLKTRGLGYDGPTGLSYLADLSSLEELRMSSGDTMLSAADLASLESLIHLRDLSVSTQDLSDQALAPIGKLKRLETLHLSCSLNRSALNKLNGLSNLRQLDVSVRPRRNATETNATDELMLDLSGLKNMKELRLSGLSLQDSDLAFLEHMPLLENLTTGSDSASPLTGACLRYLRELRELNTLYITSLSSCTGADLAHLNGLPKLKNLDLHGDITNTALAFLTDQPRLHSLNIHTDNPIQIQTITGLKERHPTVEYIRVEEPWKPPTRPSQQRQPVRVSQPHTNR
jgi:Leucine-rich repeat (LRR) protein